MLFQLLNSAFWNEIQRFVALDGILPNIENRRQDANCHRRWVSALKHLLPSHLSALFAHPVAIHPELDVANVPFAFHLSVPLNRFYAVRAPWALALSIVNPAAEIKCHGREWNLTTWQSLDISQSYFFSEGGGGPPDPPLSRPGGLWGRHRYLAGRPNGSNPNLPNFNHNSTTLVVKMWCIGGVICTFRGFSNRRLFSHSRNPNFGN